MAVVLDSGAAMLEPVAGKEDSKERMLSFAAVLQRISFIEVLSCKALARYLEPKWIRMVW